MVFSPIIAPYIWVSQFPFWIHISTLVQSFLFGTHLWHWKGVCSLLHVTLKPISACQKCLLSESLALAFWSVYTPNICNFPWNSLHVHYITLSSQTVQFTFNEFLRQLLMFSVFALWNSCASDPMTGPTECFQFLSSLKGQIHFLYAGFLSHSFL